MLQLKKRFSIVVLGAAIFGILRHLKRERARQQEQERLRQQCQREKRERDRNDQLKKERRQLELDNQRQLDHERREREHNDQLEKQRRQLEIDRVREVELQRQLRDRAFRQQEQEHEQEHVLQQQENEHEQEQEYFEQCFMIVLSLLVTMATCFVVWYIRVIFRFGAQCLFGGLTVVVHIVGYIVWCVFLTVKFLTIGILLCTPGLVWYNKHSLRLHHPADSPGPEGGRGARGDRRNSHYGGGIINGTIGWLLQALGGNPAKIGTPSKIRQTCTICHRTWYGRDNVCWTCKSAAHVEMAFSDY